MTADWQPFIQVNIYGRTLRELQQEGIALNSVLNNIGCSKLWIVEGSMYGGIDTETEYASSIDSEPEPLSTTIANVNVPRLSTPIYSKFDRRQFTMDFTENISYIHSPDEMESERKFESQIQCDTSDHGSSSPSSPTDETVVKDLLEQLVQNVCEEERNRESRRDKTIDKENTRVYQSSSRTETDEHSPPSTLKRKLTIAGVHQYKFESDSDPDICDLEYSQSALTPAIMRRMTSAKVYTNLNPVSQKHWNCPIAAEFDEIAPHYPWEEEEEEDADEFYSMHDDVTEIMNLDETIEMHTPPPPNVQIARSILRMNGKKEPSKKSVSFKVPISKKTKRLEELNREHNIKCQYKNCNWGMIWKLKYGKLRLIDHVLSHVNDKNLQCRLCDQTCLTVRQMRYHYSKKHHGEKMEGFGMLEVFSMPTHKMDLHANWLMCFKDNIAIVGTVSTNKRNRRVERSKIIKEENPLLEE